MHKRSCRRSFCKLWISRAELTEIAEPGAWLRTVDDERDVLIISEGRRDIELRLHEAGRHLAATDEDDFERQWEVKELRDTLRAGDQVAPGRRRRIFQLIKVDGYSRREGGGTIE